MSKKLFKVLLLIIIVVALIGVGIIVIPPLLQDKKLTEEAEEYDNLLDRVSRKITQEQTDPVTEPPHEEITEAITEAPTPAPVTPAPSDAPSPTDNNENEQGERTENEPPEETETIESNDITAWKPFSNDKKDKGIMLGQTNKENRSSGNGITFGKYSDNKDNISPVDNPDRYNEWLINKNKTPTPSPVPTPTPSPTPTPTPTPEPRVGYYTQVDLLECKKINDDFIAWIKIPNTNIDYPIVQSNDTDYYLEHTFEGKKSKLGTLLSLGKSNWKRPSKNIVIYGHDVEGSGDKMFKALLKYKDASYYADHSVIYLDSMYMDGKYKIFSVFDIYEGDIDPSVSSFGSNEEFLQFVYAAKDLSLYDTGVILNEEDHIITLVTCDRFFKRGKGRLVVMAVRER